MIDVRPLTEREDLKTVVRLQRQIWGFEDVDLIPLRLFVVASKIGGQVFGAFDGAQHDRLLHGHSRPASPAAKPTCTATCWACCPEYRNSPASAARSS